MNRDVRLLEIDCFEKAGGYPSLLKVKFKECEYRYSIGTRHVCINADDEVGFA